MNNILRERIRGKVGAEKKHGGVDSHEGALNVQQRLHFIPGNCPPGCESQSPNCLSIISLSRPQFQHIIFRLFLGLTSLYFYISSTSFFSSFPFSSSSFDSFSIFSSHLSPCRDVTCLLEPAKDIR